MPCVKLARVPRRGPQNHAERYSPVPVQLQGKYLISKHMTFRVLRYRRTTLAQRYKHARAREAKIQALSFSKQPGARAAIIKMATDRQWLDRTAKVGQEGLTANGRGRDGVTYKDLMLA